MSLNKSNPVTYRADIDGLRGIAVLAVLLFHADLGFPGGFVGVDIFFVISGYLITGLILRDLADGKFEIREFWERRVRRILPAVAVVLLACLAAGWFWFLPLDYKSLGQSVLAQTTLVSNFYFWRESGYFAQAAEVKPLLHTWSLAVEEQFYLLFPFLLIALNRFARKSLVPAILLIGGVSFSLSVYCSHRHSSANFYLLPTRAWELLMGSFLAALPARSPSPRWRAELLSWGGLLAIFGAMFFYDRETRFPGVAALLPCVGAALVIWTNQHAVTGVGNLLAVRPIVFVGLVSYSLYLWHWPVLVFAKNLTLSPLTLSQRIILLFASMIAAVLSWRFVETPIRKRVILTSRAQIIRFASLTTTVCLLTGFAVHKLQGLPSRIPANALRYADGEIDHAFLNELSLQEARDGKFIELGMADMALPIDLFVWGDSHAMAAMPVLDLLCKEHAIRGVAATHSSTAPLVGYASHGMGEGSIPFNKSVVDFIRSNRVSNVLLVADWSYYATLYDHGETAQLRRGMLDTLHSLEDTGARIWIMKQVPQQPWNVPRALASAVLQGRNPEEMGLRLTEHYEVNQLQDKVFGGVSSPGVTILDPTVCFVGPQRLYRVAQGGKALYRDDHHLTVAGAMVLRPLFEPIFGGSRTLSAPVRDHGIPK